MSYFELYRYLNFDYMQHSANVLKYALLAAKNKAKEGVTTSYLDNIVEDYILSHECTPAFKGYNGFPCCTCISVNNELVHGIPGDRVLNKGDLVKIDSGAVYNGHCSDSAISIVIEEDDNYLIEVAKKALYNAIELIDSYKGAHLKTGDIGHEIQRAVELSGYHVVLDLGGHGIGFKPHLPPFVPNYGIRGTGDIISSGMYIAVEPVVLNKRSTTSVSSDGWTVVSDKNCLAAHVEHTLAITDSGVKILTEV